MFDREASLRRSVRAMAAAHAGVLEDVAELDEERVWERDGSTSMSAWLAGMFGLTRATATEWVRAARALKSLPHIARTYRKGLLSWDQLPPLTKFAVAETDERWAADAPSYSVAYLWQESRRHEAVNEREAAEAHRWRYLSLDWNEERTELYLAGRFGAEQGAALERAVAKRSEEIVVADDPYDPVQARAADALVELACEGSGSGGDAVMVVHADALVVSGRSARGLSETESGERLTVEAIRRLACDARIEWTLERDGHTVGIGRRGRTVPGTIARAVRFRDRGCRFPGCGRTRWLKTHHIVHWANGGGTDLENLVQLCHAHHRLIHEGGWSIRGRPGTELRFHDPGGRDPFARPSAATSVAA
jgi:hypothetical protein